MLARSSYDAQVVWDKLDPVVPSAGGVFGSISRTQTRFDTKLPVGRDRAEGGASYLERRVCVIFPIGWL